MGQKLRTTPDSVALWALCYSLRRDEARDAKDEQRDFLSDWEGRFRVRRGHRTRVMLDRWGLRKGLGYLVRDEGISAGLDALTKGDLEWLASEDWTGYSGHQRMLDWLRKKGREALEGKGGRDI